MVMLNCLVARAQGLLDPRSFVKVHMSKRLLGLRLSETKTFESGSARTISNCLDVDATDGRYLLTAQSDGSLRIFDTQPPVDPGTGCATLPCVAHKARGSDGAHLFSVNTVQWYPVDTGMFVSSGNDKTVKVWDTNALAVVEEHKLDGVVYSHDMSQVAVKNNLIVAAPQSGKVAIIDLVSGSKAHTLIGHDGAVYATKWSTGSEFELATGGADGRINVWDIRQSKGAKFCLDQFSERRGDEPASSQGCAHNNEVLGLEYTPDGRSIVSYGRDDRLKVWSAANGGHRDVNFGPLVNDLMLHVKFSLATNVWPEMAFVPCDSDVAVLDIATGATLAKLQGHFNQVHCVCLHPNLPLLFSSSSDHNLLVWEDARHMWKEEEEEKHQRQTAASFYARVGADEWSSESEEEEG